MPLKYGLIEPADISVPHLPRSLDGLRIAHLSDLHIQAHRPRHQRLMTQLASMRLDLVVFTGDYMSEEGDEPEAAAVLERLVQPLRPRYGCFGVLGNHDSPDLRAALAGLPIHWLDNTAARVADRPIELLGLDMDSSRQRVDASALMRGAEEQGVTRPAPRAVDAPRHGRAEERPVRLMLCHYPQAITIAADLGVDLMLAGHTHGGQIRLPSRRPLVNSCDLPLRLTTGLLRHQNTQAAVSRGLGEIALPMRLFCPPHVPVYTLRGRSMPGRYTDAIECLWRW